MGNLRRACRGVLFLVLCLEGKAFGEVIFERKPEPDTLERYELTGRNLYLENNTSKEDLQNEVVRMREKAQNSKTIVKVELLFDLKDNCPYFSITALGKDRIKEAADKKWREYAFKNLLVEDFSPFRKQGASSTREQWDMYPDRPAGYGWVTTEYVRPKGEKIDVWIGESHGGPIRLHEWMRRIIGMGLACRVAKHDVHQVIWHDQPWKGASWPAGEGRFVSILGGREFPKEVVNAYLKKFPSTLPEDFKLDKASWGKDELDFYLGCLKQAIEVGAPWGGRDFGHYFGYAGKFICLPFFKDVQITKETPLQKKVELYEQLLKWWNANKERTYWDEKLQQLVANGFSSEEWAESEKKRKKEAWEARLDSPPGENGGTA